MINQTIFMALVILGAAGVCFVWFLIASRKRVRDLLRQIERLKTELFLERNKEMMEFIKKDRTDQILSTSRDVGRRIAADHEAAVLNQAFGGAQ